MPAPKSLDDIYQIVTPKDLLGGYELSALGGSSQNTILAIVNTLLGHNSGGLFSTADIIKYLQALSTVPNASNTPNNDSINNTIWIFPITGETFPGASDRYGFGVRAGGTLDSPAQGVSLAEALKATAQSDNTKTALGVIMTHTPNITLNVRNTNIISTFLRAIPTIEMSRAMPYLDVQFLLARNPLGGQDGKTVNVPSLIKFLNGAQTVKDNSPDAAMLNGMVPQAQGTNVATQTDMSLFLTPATLVNYTPDNTRSNRAAPVIDPTRPFLSIDHAEINVDASPSWAVAFKSMKLFLTLHDRSRLAEIADLIRPATYTGTSARVTYGWFHPDGHDPQRKRLSSDAKTFGLNVWADTINQMRITEIYGIKNASYAFDQTGQVKITLQLYMLGNQEMYVSRISEDETYKSTRNRLLEIGELVARLAEQLGLNNDRWKETRVPQFLDAAERGERPDLDAKDFAKALADVRAIVVAAGSAKNSTNKQAASDLADKLDEIFGSTDGTKKGILEQLKKYVEGQLDSKLTVLSSTPDPFFDYKGAPPPQYYEKLLKGNILSSKDGTTVTNKVASLAKIVALYVGQPLRALAKFDEVQIVFHPFNEYAGYMRGRNIGELPVEIDYFKKIMNDYAVKKNNRDFTVDAFIRLIQDSIISDPRTAAFGLAQLYKNANSPEEPPQFKEKKDAKDVATELDSIMSATGGGTWKQPVIELFMECMPKAIFASADPNTPNDLDPNAIILRLHIYDRQATPYNAFLQVAKVQSQLQEGIDVVNKSSEQPDRAKGALAGLKAAADALQNANPGLTGISPTISSDQNVVVNVEANFDTVKKFITQTVPTFVMGSNNTGVYNINVQTIQDPALNSVNQLRAGGGGTARPNGSGIGGLPLRVIPGQIEMNSIGCPLLTLNQQWFIDLGTGTDMDNFYGLTGLSHTLAPGKFESVMRFIWMDAYGTYESILAQIQRLKNVLKPPGQ